MRQYPLIDTSWGDTKLDPFLKEEYGLGLPVFGYILAQAFIGGLWPSSPALGRTKASARNELECLCRICLKLQNSLDNYCKRFPVLEGYKGLNDEKEKQNRLTEKFGLNSFVQDFVRLRIGLLEEILKYAPGRKGGQSIGVRSQVILAWAPLMQKKGGIHWLNMARLFKWFYDRLYGAEYAGDISATNDFKKESTWIRNAYNSNLKVLRKSRISRRTEQKAFNNYKLMVASMRLIRYDGLPNIFCVKFIKDKVEIRQGRRNHVRALTVRLVNGEKRPLYPRLLRRFSPKEPRSIIFDKGLGEQVSQSIEPS